MNHEQVGLDAVRGDAGWGVVEYHGDPRPRHGGQTDPARRSSDVRHEIGLLIGASGKPVNVLTYGRQLMGQFGITTGLGLNQAD